MQELMFYDECPGPYVILGDFAAVLGAAMMKTVNQNELPGIQTSHNGDRFQRDSADLLQSLLYNL